MRYNPYPVYIDCDEAFDSLVDEIRNADFEALSPKLGDLVRESLLNARASRANTDELSLAVRAAEMIYDIRSPNDVGAFYEQLYTPEYQAAAGRVMFSLNSSKNVHAAYLMTDIGVVNDVRFVHTFPQSRRAAIKEEGIYGRATPAKLSLTRNVPDFYIRGNGFIFAYEEDTFYEGDTVVMFKTYISGHTSKALKIYFEPDSEVQLVVPVKCITSYEFGELPDTYEPEWGWLDEDGDTQLPHPSTRAYGSEVACQKCGLDTRVTEQTHNSAGAICVSCGPL